MAKKKRKHLIKLNNKVRELFGNLPFDEGVITLSDDELLELVLLLDLNPPTLDRDENIRALRRAWSEGSYQLRRDIVSHLSGKKPITPQGRQRSDTLPTNKVDKIVEFLDSLDCSSQEEQIILESFMDMSPAKITREKIESKLDYIRLQRRVKTLESRLSVEFTPTNEIEFYHSYSFDFTQYSFSKTLLTRSHHLDMTALLSGTDDEIVEQLNSIKLEMIESKMLSVSKFVSTFVDHRYLSQEDACRLTKSIPVETDLYHNPIDIDLIERIVSSIDPDCYLSYSTAHFIIEKSMSAELFGTQIPYRISIAYEKSLIYAIIWRGDDIPIADDIHSQNRSILDSFSSAISEMESELVELSVGLGIDSATIQKQIVQIVEPVLAS